MDRRRFLATLSAAPLPLVSLQADPAKAADMAERAQAFLQSLSEEQRAKAAFAFADRERLNWHYVPKLRKGIPLKELNAAQKVAAFALLDSGLSEDGRTKARRIMELESVLAIMENNPTLRDPELYYVFLFGEPGDPQGWGWRVEGHHLSVNLTVVGEHVSATPSFWGANPAEVRQEGPLHGVRTLSKEEDLARQLARSLHAAGKPVVTAPEAPREYTTRVQTRVSALEEPGVPFSEFDAAQRALLQSLVSVYASNFQADIAAQELACIEAAGWDKVQFSWKGGLETGEKHYYLIQGPSFLLEYVNYQNDGNHIHSAWRSFAGDYGLDALS